MLPTPSLTSVTPAEFDRLVVSDEFRQRHLELLNGRIVEKMVTHPESSELAGKMFMFLGMHAYSRRMGRITTADGGYHIGEQRVMPDCAFIRAENADAPVVAGYCAAAPDLAVEVISPSDTHDDVQEKIRLYREGGVLLWLIDPQQRRVTVYDGMATPVELGIGDTLTGGRVLPDFALALADYFATN